jgi:DNA-binding transcriptional MerR regulator
MPERNGYKTIDVIMEEIGATEEQVRALIALLNIKPEFFPDDRRRRYYSPQDVDRIKLAIRSGRQGN